METEIRASIGSRLKQERDRLGLTQGEFALLGGAKPRTLQDWERGLAAVSSEFLTRLSEHGVDAGYVLTGRMSGQSQSMGAFLSNEENVLIERYRQIDARGREGVEMVVDAVARARPRLSLIKK